VPSHIAASGDAYRIAAKSWSGNFQQDVSFQGTGLSLRDSEYYGHVRLN